MKIKVKSLLMVLAAAFGLSFGLAACSGECDHTYKDEVVAPTCTEAGHTLHTCTKCGDSFSDTEVEALGHDYRESVVAPKCVEDGYTLHACSRCDDSYQDTKTDAIGHDFAQTLSYDDEGHYHLCTRCDEHDTLVEHDYDETDYQYSATGHYTVCECGARTEEAAHTYTQEVMNDDTIIHAANCLEPATYAKSCVCGAMSVTDTFTDGEALGHELGHYAAVAGTETTKASIEYWECGREDCGKLYADAAATSQITESDIYSEKIGRLLTTSDKKTENGLTSTDNFVDNAEDNSMTYTKAVGAPANEAAKLWFGKRIEDDNTVGGDCTAWEFDLNVDVNGGELSLVFRAFDANTLYRLYLCKPTGNGHIEFEERQWDKAISGPRINNRIDISGFTIGDNIDYHVMIICRGDRKVVEINGRIIFSVQNNTSNDGYFGIESKGVNSLVIKNAYLRNYIGSDDEKHAALEDDYPELWDDLSEGITTACAHDYVDTVVPPTCIDDGYTTHKCDYCHDEYTDTTVPSVGAHVYDTYTDNGDNHTAICSACGDETEQAHSFVKEIKNENTLKTAENHEHGATYYKSCACGAVSANESDTFTAAQVYKYLSDAVTSTNFTQAADGTLTHHAGASNDLKVGSLTFGSQDGNQCQYVEFDMEFTAGDWGSFELQFRRWDPNKNLAVVRQNKHNHNGELRAIKTEWTLASGRTEIGAWSMSDFKFNDNTKYHVQIVCSGWQKMVIVDGTVIFNVSFDGYNVGYFHLETWDLNSITISNIIVKESPDSDKAAFDAEHAELQNNNYNAEI